STGRLSTALLPLLGSAGRVLYFALQNQVDQDLKGSGAGLVTRTSERGFVMASKPWQGFGALCRGRQPCGLAGAIVIWGAGSPSSASSDEARAQQPTAEEAAQHEAYSTTVAYVSQFYPLCFTYNQSRFATHNRLVGPARVTQLYQTVVAINVDT